MKTSGQQGNVSTKATQGLATLALLKVNFDAGRDHIDMFMPFVLDCISSLATQTFSSEEILTLIHARHQLNIPESILVTLLSRAARRGYLERARGRYTRVEERVADSDITPIRQRVEREHANVAQALRAFTASRGIEIQSDEEALALILRFFEQFHMAMLLDENTGSIFRIDGAMSRRESVMVARFLEETFRSEPARTEYVARMLEGFVLQNALLLKDIAIAGRRFKDLFVYVDTGFVLRALGLAGEAHAISTRETLDLLKATGAEFGVFEKTIEEIERILRIYERKLATTAGILSLRPTDVTRHFVANRYSPGDVAKALALLRQNLRQLGIRICDFPKRDARWTSDEKALTKLLCREDETELDPRITHDVDCVAAILTIRKGLKPQSIDDARAVFATTSASVVRTVREWYRASGEECVPPVVHAWALSNAAWLKKPTAATTQKLHELVALCSAALQPSKKAWKAFLTELKRLEKDDQITSNEHVALVARELTGHRLSEVEGDGDIDVKTINEVIETARAEEEERISRVVAGVRSVEDEKLATVKSALAASQKEAWRLTEEKRQTDLRIRGLVQGVAAVISWAFFILVGLILVWGVGLCLPGIFPQAGGLFQQICWVIVGLLAVMTTINLIYGTTVRDLRMRLQIYLEQRVMRWFIKTKDENQKKVDAI